MLNLRDGVRRNYTEVLEAVVYADKGIPSLANECEINFSGMRCNVDIDCKCGSPVRVHLFMDREAILNLNAVLLRREGGKSSIVKFKPLTSQERLILSQIVQ